MSGYGWSAYGLSKEGAALAASAIHAMDAIVARIGPEVARAVFEEAIFRSVELPRRDPEFRARYLAQEWA